MKNAHICDRHVMLTEGLLRVCAAVALGLGEGISMADGRVSCVDGVAGREPTKQLSSRTLRLNRMRW